MRDPRDKYHIEPPMNTPVKPKFKKLCHACVANYSELSPAEKAKAAELDHPIQFLKPCCPKQMIIACSCGELEEKFPMSVIALWLRTAYTVKGEEN